MSTSLSSEEAPKRKRSGVIQAAPSVSLRTQRYWIACFAVLIPPAGFIPTTRPVSSCTSLITSSMQSVTGQRRGRAHLAGRGLDEVGAGGDREQRGAADVVVRAELAGLEDHLQVRRPHASLTRDDLVDDLRVAAGEEGAAVDHHVDLVRAELERPAHVVELHLDRRLPRRERRRDGGDLDRRARERRAGDADEVRVDAHGRHGRDGAVGRVGPPRLRAERRDLARACRRPRASSGPSSGRRGRGRRASPPS